MDNLKVNMQEVRGSVSAFFADLLNAGDLDMLKPKELERLQLEAPGANLATLQQEARRLVASLDRGGAHALPFRLLLDGSGGRVAARWTNPNPQLDLLAQLVTLTLQRGRLPLMPCQVCQRIFPQHGRGLYCSLRCQRQATDDRRQEQRRDYKRTYMATRRAQEKELAEIQKRAQARRRAGKLPAGARVEAAMMKTLPVLPVETDAQRKARQEGDRERLRAAYEKKQQRKATRKEG